MRSNFGLAQRARLDRIARARVDLPLPGTTLKRAKDERGVKSEKSGFGAGWLWFLPGTEHGEVKAA